MNLEFCANGKAQAVTDTKLGQLASLDAGTILSGMVSGLASTGLH